MSASKVVGHHNSRTRTQKSLGVFKPKVGVLTQASVQHLSPELCSVSSCGSDCKFLEATCPRRSVRRYYDLAKTPEFKRWFDGSVVTETTKAGGRPLLMFHGTWAQDSFTVFRGDPHNEGRSGVIFVTSSPSLASEFSAWRDYADYVAKGDLEGSEHLRPRVFPVYVRAVEPFDYRKSRHITKFMEAVESQAIPWVFHYGDTTQLKEALESGTWGIYEYPEVQDWLKSQGFDGFWSKESFVRSRGLALGVFSSNQIKSALANTGKFDSNSLEIQSSFLGSLIQVGSHFSSSPSSFAKAHKLWVQKGVSMDILLAIKKVRSTVQRQIRSTSGCWESAMVWANALQSKGEISPCRIQVILGHYTDSRHVYLTPSEAEREPHVWLEIDGKIVDPTAGQWEDYPNMVADKYLRKKIIASSDKPVRTVLDRLPQPPVMWVENEAGEVIRTEQDILGPPGEGSDENWGSLLEHGSTVGHSQGLSVREMMYTDNGTLGSAESTVNCSYPILKYLIETRGWDLNRAAILVSELCEGCMNVCLQELGEDMGGHDPYATTTFCHYCQIIRPERYAEEIEAEPDLEKRAQEAWKRRGALERLVSGVRRVGIHRLAHVANYSYSSTQVNVPEDLASKIRTWARETIDKDDLYDDPDDPTSSGLEDHIHCTVLYGLTGESETAVQRLRDLVRGHGPIQVVLGKVSLFPGDDEKPYDVVKISVTSEHLQRLHKLIKKELPNKETYPKYKPHVTLAYVKAGTGKKYEGLDRFEGEEFEVEHFVFAPKEDKKRDVVIRTASESRSLPSKWIQPYHAVRSKAHVDALARKMRVRGWVGDPLLVLDFGGQDYRALTGVHRLAAALKAGLDHVPVEVVDVSEHTCDEEGNCIECDGPCWVNLAYNADHYEDIPEILKEAGELRAAQVMEAEISKGEGSAHLSKQVGKHAEKCSGPLEGLKGEARRGFQSQVPPLDSSAIRKAVRENKAFEILDRTGPSGSDWGCGACWMLARALQRIYGGDLYALRSTQTRQAEHVVLKVGDKYVDHDGVFTASQIVKKEGFGSGKTLTLVPLSECDTGGIEGSQGSEEGVLELSDFLRGELSKSESLGTHLAKIQAPNTPEFKAWFGKSKVVNSDGSPKVVFHGTTHIFEEFSVRRTDPANFLGRGLYFTDNPKDLENYIGQGPDLTNRLEGEAEKILRSRGEDEEYPYGSPEYGRQYQRAMDLAKKRLVGPAPEGVAMPVYLKIEKPLYLTKGFRFPLEIEYEEDVNGDTVSERGSGIKFLQNLQKLCKKYGIQARDLDVLVSRVYEALREGVSTLEMDELLRSDAGITNLENKYGQLVFTTVLQNLYRKSGFDGIITDAEFYFGRIGKGMHGVEGTTHYIVFDPRQVKSALGNVGTYDSKSKSIGAHFTPHLVPQHGSSMKHLEGKFLGTSLTRVASRMRFFHGTSTARWPGIRSQGLIPHLKTRVWEQGKSSPTSKGREPGDHSLESYPGSYVTGNYSKAYSAAVTAVQTFGGDILILSGVVETRSPDARVDEDHFSSPVWHLKQEGLIFNPRDFPTQALPFLTGEPYYDLDAAASKWAESLSIPTQALSEVLPLAKRLIVSETVLNALLGVESSYADSLRRGYWWDGRIKQVYDAASVKFGVTLPSEMVQLAERTYRADVNALLGKITKYLETKERGGFIPSFRFEEKPIGFSGSNFIDSAISIPYRIEDVAAVKVLYKKGDLGVNAILRGFETSGGYPYVLIENGKVQSWWAGPRDVSAMKLGESGGDLAGVRGQDLISAFSALGVDVLQDLGVSKQDDVVGKAVSGSFYRARAGSGVLDLDEVNALFEKLFKSNYRVLSQEEESQETYELAWSILFQDGRYKVLGPNRGEHAEVEFPGEDTDPIVGLLHTHPGGQEAELTEADEEVAQEVSNRTGLPLLMGVIGTAPYDDEGGLTLVLDEFEPQSPDPTKKVVGSHYQAAYEFSYATINKLKQRMPAKMPVGQFQKWLDSQQIPKEDRRWLGLDQIDALSKQGQISKADVIAYAENKAPKLEEKVLGAPTRGELDAASLSVFGMPYEDLNPTQQGDIDRHLGDYGATKYQKWALPEGQDYQEMVVKLPGSQSLGSYAEWLGKRLGITPTEAESTPEYDDDHWYDWFVQEEQVAKKSFHSPHWDDSNVLLHTRYAQHQTQNGKSILVIEEVQSDWHEKGRTHGYAKDPSGWTARLVSEPGARFAQWEVRDAEGNYLTTIVGGTEQEALQEAAAGVPHAPFKASWPEYAMKRMLAMAAERGYAYLGWPLGIEQSARYDLSKQVDAIQYYSNKDGTFDIGIIKDGKSIEDEDRSGVTPGSLANLVGKELAQRILNGEGTPKVYPGTKIPFRELSGPDLWVGGGGMVAFYDLGGTSSQNVANFMQKYVKPYGSQVQQVRLKNGHTVWAVPITPGLKAFVERGQELRVARAGDSSTVWVVARNALGERSAFFYDVDLEGKVTPSGLMAFTTPPAQYTVRTFAEKIGAKRITPRELERLRHSSGHRQGEMTLSDQKWAWWDGEGSWPEYFVLFADGRIATVAGFGWHYVALNQMQRSGAITQEEREHAVEVRKNDTPSLSYTLNAKLPLSAKQETLLRRWQTDLPPGTKLEDYGSTFGSFSFLSSQGSCGATGGTKRGESGVIGRFYSNTFLKAFKRVGAFLETEAGKPLPLYHGTSVAGFTSFKPGLDGFIYLTPSPEYAENYTSGSFSGVTKLEDSPLDRRGIYKVYLQDPHVFDTTTSEHRKIFEEEYLGKYSTSTAPLDAALGLPDWTEAGNLKEFFEEKDYPFDTIKLADAHGYLAYAVADPAKLVPWYKVEHKATQGPTPELTFENEVTGSHHGQIDGLLKAVTSEGEVAGHLWWAVFRENAFIQSIEVFPQYQRLGVGTRMLQYFLSELAKDFPGKTYRPSSRTPEGTAFFRSPRVKKVFEDLRLQRTLENKSTGRSQNV